jgi:hypothetical protein
MALLLPAPAVRADGDGLAAARVELALWVESLSTSLPRGEAPPAHFPQAAHWLAGASGEPDAAFARALCGPRYAALAGHGEVLARRLAAADSAGALALYRGRILPTCLEIAICLRAASPCEEER